MSQGLGWAGSGLEASFAEAPAAAWLPWWGANRASVMGRVVATEALLNQKGASTPEHFTEVFPAHVCVWLGGKLSLVEVLKGVSVWSRGQTPPLGHVALGEDA